MVRRLILLSGIMIISASGQKDMNKETENKSTVLSFVADTQAPMWIEGVFLRKDNNPEATKKILSGIFDSRPSSLFMLGDVVSLGVSTRAWVIIDYSLNLKYSNK